MSRTFAETAQRLSGVVPRTLGWLPQNFWEATPAELAAIFTAEEPLGGEPLSRWELNEMMEREGHG